MVTKKEGGQEGDSKSASVWHYGDRGYLKFEPVPFLCKTQYFRFRLLQLYIKVLSRQIGEALRI